MWLEKDFAFHTHQSHILLQRLPSNTLKARQHPVFMPFTLALHVFSVDKGSQLALLCIHAHVS